MSRHEIACAWQRTVAPTLSPVSIDEVKAHARITDSNSDQLIEDWIDTSVEAAETYMNRGLLTQTWALTLAWWANVIELPMAAPLQSVSSVTYYDADGVQQTLATSVYAVDTTSRPGRVVLAPDQSWPEVQSDRRIGPITITYVVGWTSQALVPERIKQGLKQYVTYLDQDRDGMSPNALNAKTAAERCWSDVIAWAPPRWRC